MKFIGTVLGFFGLLTSSTTAQDWTLVAHLDGSVVGVEALDVENLNNCNSKRCKMSDADINALAFDLIKFEPVVNDASKPITYFDFRDRIWSSNTAVAPCSTPWTLSESNANGQNFDGVETCCLYDVCNFGRGHCGGTVKSSYGFKSYGGCGESGTIVGVSGVRRAETRIWVNVAGGSSGLSDMLEYASNLNFNDDCEISFNSPTEVILACSFASDERASTKVEILIGSCSDNDNFERPAEGSTMTAALVTGSVDFASTISTSNKNSGIFTKSFCARADVFSDDNGTLKTIGAQKYEITATLTYDLDGNFEVNGIQTAEFTADDENASAMREASVQAYRCDDAGADATDSGDVTVGSKLNVCVYSDDADMDVSVTDLTISSRNTEITNPIDNSVANFVTAVEEVAVSGRSDKVQKVSTLMITKIFDTAANQVISASGTAALTYNRRKLQVEGAPHNRALQSGESAAFSVDVKLSEKELPAIASESEANGADLSHVHGVFGGMMALVVAAAL